MLTSIGVSFEKVIETLKGRDAESFLAIASAEGADVIGSILNGQKAIGILLTQASKEMTNSEIENVGWLIIGLSELAKIWHENKRI